MVCMRVASHENDGKHENDEDNQTATNKGLSAGLAEIRSLRNDNKISRP